MNSLLKNSFFTLLVCFAVSANTYAAERSDGEISARSGKGAVSNDAKAGQVGVGLQVGGLTGLALQYWLSDINGINGSITSDRGNTAFSLAHIWFFPKALATLGRGSQAFVPYAGVGALVAFGNQPDYFTRNTETTAMAAQIPLGIEFLPRRQRFDIFAEFAPSLEVSPQSVGFVTADLGARFYF